MAGLTVTEESRQNALVIRAEGRLVIGEIEPLQKRLERIWKGEPKRVVIDLAHCRFIDSGGIALLVTNLKRAQQTGKRLVLVSPQPQIRSVLELTRLDTVFAVCDSVEAALEA